jgi:flagellar biosynthesis protein FlhF
MKIKRYTAANMRAALAQVRAEQGPDAVILSSRRSADGIEVIAVTSGEAQNPRVAIPAALRTMDHQRRRSPSKLPASTMPAPTMRVTAAKSSARRNRFIV